MTLHGHSSRIEAVRGQRVVSLAVGFGGRTHIEKRRGQTY